MQVTAVTASATHLNADTTPPRPVRDDINITPHDPLAAPLMSGLQTIGDSRRSNVSASQAGGAPVLRESGQFRVISAWPAGNVGDSNQSIGIASAVRRKLVQHNLAAQDDISSETLEIAHSPTASAAEQLTAACDTSLAKLRGGEYDRLVFILSGSGDKLASTLGSRPAEKGLTTVFSGHQLSDDIKSAEALPSITALPERSVNADQRDALESKTKLVLVSGVAHQLSKDKIEQTVAEYRAKGYPPIPEVDGNTVGVILGGDAPDEAGNTHYFSENDAVRLAHHIAARELKGREHCRFIVTNGPRTGKFDRTGMECSPNPHKTEKVDHVTKAFADALKDALQTYEGSEVHLFNFEFDKKPSAYMPMIDAFMQAGSNRGRIHVPGESVSMVSEVTSVVSGVVIDEIASMNPSHRTHVEQVLEQSGAAMLDIDGKLQLAKPQSRPKQTISAADKIADAVVTRILET